MPPTSQVPGPSSPTTRLRRSRWLAPLIVLIVAAVALGAGVAIGRYNESASSSSRFANTQAACDEWAASSSNNKPDNAWCSGMVSWMSGHMGGGMMGSNFGDGPDHMRDACRRWVASEPGNAGGSAAKRCDDMVTWMDGQATDGWDNWMMQRN